MVRIVGDGWKYRRELEVGDDVFDEGIVTAGNLQQMREKKTKGNIQQTRFIGRVRRMQGVEESGPDAMNVEKEAVKEEGENVSSRSSFAQRLDSLDTEVKEIRSSVDTVKTTIELMQMDMDESNEKMTGCLNLLQKIWDKLSSKRSPSRSPAPRSPLPPPSPPSPPSDFPAPFTDPAAHVD